MEMLATQDTCLLDDLPIDFVACVFSWVPDVFEKYSVMGMFLVFERNFVIVVPCFNIPMQVLTSTDFSVTVA